MTACATEPTRIASASAPVRVPAIQGPEAATVAARPAVIDPPPTRPVVDIRGQAGRVVATTRRHWFDADD